MFVTKAPYACIGLSASYMAIRQEKITWTIRSRLGHIKDSCMDHKQYILQSAPLRPNLSGVGPRY